MLEFDSKERSEQCRKEGDFLSEKLAEEKDLVMEQILENINKTPIGQVLKKLASLPEVRQKKILGVRQQLTEGEYDMKDRLNIALDKVLEDLTT